MSNQQTARAILKERARAASQTSRKRTGGRYLEVVELLIAGEKHAFESSYIREIYPLKQLTPLPGTPPFVLGIISVRGQIVSVVDIKKYFDLPETELTDVSRVVIIHSEDMEFGVLADLVLGVRQVRIDEIQSSLPTLTGIRKDYLRGVTADQTTIWDAAKLLGDKRMIVHDTSRLS